MPFQRFGNWVRFFLGGGTVITRLVWEQGYRQGVWNFLDDAHQAERLQRLANQLAEENTPLKHLVEIGCGSGAFLRFLPNAVQQYTGVDLSAEALTRARQVPVSQTITMQWIQADAEVWNPEPGWQEPLTLLFNESLYYFHDPAGQVQRFLELLPPGSMLHISMWETFRFYPVLWKLRRKFPGSETAPIRVGKDCWRQFLLRR